MPAHNLTRLSGEKLKQSLQNLSRQVFIEVLATWMECSPNPEELSLFANKYPDRWANGIAVLSRLTGFSDKLEINQNINVTVQSLSDAQLLQRLQELRESLSSDSSQMSDIEKANSMAKAPAPKRDTPLLLLPPPSEKPL